MKNKIFTILALCCFPLFSAAQTTTYKVEKTAYKLQNQDSTWSEIQYQQDDSTSLTIEWDKNKLHLDWIFNKDYKVTNINSDKTRGIDCLDSDGATVKLFLVERKDELIEVIIQYSNFKAIYFLEND